MLALSVVAAAPAARPGSAGSQVLYQGPDSRPIDTRYGEADTGAQEMNAPPPKAVIPPQRIVLPLRPRRLTVGDEPTRPLPSVAGVPHPRLSRPLFLIGTDPSSLEWLATHADALAELGAAGLIVQAETPADVGRVKSIAPTVPMFAAPGDDVAEQLGIRRYPVVIGPDTIRPQP